MSHEGKFRSLTFGVPAGFCAVLVLIALTSVPCFANNVDTQSYLGSAYGTSAFVGNTVLVGQTAPVTLGGTCGTSQQPLNVPGSAAGVTLFPILRGGAVNTDVSSSPQTAQASANTASITLLSGLISAQDIKAVSTTTLTNNAFQVSSAGSTFSNLVILGHVYNGSVPANTTINLPLVGYVVLNEQTSNIQTSMANLTVNMIHVHVTVANILGLRVGTEIIVSNATSGMLNVFAPAIMSSQSFGTEVLGPLLNSAPTAPVMTPCLGTNGSVITNTLAGLNLPPILNSGTVTNTGETKLTIPMSSGRSTSTVQGLNLLNGLITANIMTAQVVASANDTYLVTSNGTDSFLGISVTGHPEIVDSVPYNTSVSLAGLGTLYLKRIINTNPPTHSLEVRSLELVINQNNSYGLPIGLDVIVGDAAIQVVGHNVP
jgi:hypothetical protein